MIGAVAEIFPDDGCQEHTVRFYRNVPAKVPKSKRIQTAAMLKAIQTQGALRHRHGRGRCRGEETRRDETRGSDQCVRDGAAETLVYTHLPRSQRRRIPTNNAIERLNHEIGDALAWCRRFPGREVRSRARHSALEVHS